ncbi:hypothetical protein FACS1894170_12090 [Planctomycetales bacterium]|nr:hypothetical protein FACS1894170_12090 [Planctomycetales bacterium]
MPNFFYYNANGQKLGPFNDQHLKALVRQGIVTPQTPLETDTGHKGKAGQIKGLTFSALPTPESTIYHHPFTDMYKPKEQKISWLLWLLYVLFGLVFGFLAFLIELGLGEVIIYYSGDTSSLWRCGEVVRFGIIAFGLSLAESIMQNNFFRAALRGIVGGIIGMAVGFLLFTYERDGFVWALVLNGLLGSFIAIAPGIIPPNLKKIVIGALGGAISMVLIFLLAWSLDQWSLDPIYGHGYPCRVLTSFICNAGMGSLIGFVIGTLETTTKNL